MREYVAAAMAFVATKTRQEPGFNEDNFGWFWILARQRTDYSDVPNYEACLESLRDDEVISKQLNQRVGLTASAVTMMKLILDLGWRDNKYEFDPTYFDREYRIFEDTFYSNVRVCSALAPVEGLLWDAKPLQLTDQMTISQLKQEEVPWSWTHWNSLWCALRVQYELPKFHRDIDDRGASIKKQEEIELQVRDELDYVINVLRVFANCFDFYYSAVIFQEPKWLGGQDRPRRSRALGSGLGGYLLNDRDTSAFKAWWSTLEQPKTRDHLEVSIRRVGDACIRYRNEDKILDLMIAAESLFLRASQRRSKGSLIAKLAANSLETNADARRRVKKHFTMAYKLRNAVVHEGNLKSVAIVPKDLDQFVGKTQMLMREAILQKLRELDRSN